MQTYTYTQIRKNFAQAMNKVCDDHMPLIITRQSEKPVVMISLEDFNSIEETLHLFRSPKNAARLLKAMSDVSLNKLKEQNIVEET